MNGQGYGSVGGQSNGSNNSNQVPSYQYPYQQPQHQHQPAASQPISHILNAHHIPVAQPQAQQAAYATLGGAGQAQPQPGYARPKSAGAVRRAPAAPAAAEQAPRTINLANVYGSAQAGVPPQYHMYAPQQQPTAPAQQPVQVTPHLNHYNVSPAGVIVGGATTTTRPLSANATSHTRDPKAYQLPVDHWSTTYKAHYGYSASGAPVSSAGATASNAATAPQMVSYGAEASSSGGAAARPSSASAVQTKLRHAVQLDVAVNNVNAVTAQIAQTHLHGSAQPNTQHVYLNKAADPLDGDDDGDMGLDTAAVSGTGTSHVHTHGQRRAPSSAQPAGANLGAEDDDDEMDGKPVDLSRSHPEVSMTTPSASLELHGSSHGVDVRNTSLDSFSEDHLVVGLSTVPNQFCTKRDAFELRKLLALSAGTRGGIVPSSSAVMDMYMVGKVVGVGSYGKVRAAWHRLTSSKVAIKTYDKSKLKDPAHWKRVHAEIKIMEQISHPRIARMYEAVETPKRMHLIMECLDGGNLCSYVKAKRRLSEDESKRIFFQIAQAIDHLHALGVSHRDVKLENVLFANDRDIKLIDFGFSTVCQPGKRLKVFCGTPSCKYIRRSSPYYTSPCHSYVSLLLSRPTDMAPEIVRRSEYEGKPVDMWSMGILLYALLCGCFPFRAKAYPDLYRRIARGTFPMPEELSAPVKDLLKQLLNVDAATRITAHATLRHSWLQVQLINAPNMDKMRLETPILISDKPADDLDDEVIAELEKFGMQRDEVVRLVLTKTHSSLATLYYLLLDTIAGRRKAMKQRPSSASGGVISSSALSGAYRTKPTSATGSSSAGMTSGSGGATYTGAPAAPVGAHTAGGALKARLGGEAGVAAAMAAAAAAQYDTPAAAMAAQQTAADQMALRLEQQQLQQQAIDRQEYRLRPKSASQNRAPTSQTQRPLSAYAGRR
jgi:serine/threonine protein kinase